MGRKYRKTIVALMIAAVLFCIRYDVCILQRKTAVIIDDIIPYAPPVANVKDYGARGDGSSADNQAIQKAINSGSPVVSIPAGRYMIDAAKPLIPKSGQSIILDEKAELKVIPNELSSYQVFYITNARDIVIEGGTFIGDRDEHLGTSGEWGMGIYIGKNSENITVRNCSFRDFWGDGIYIGGSGDTALYPINNITVENVICTNNRRMGITVTHGSNITIRYDVCNDAKGTKPEGGICIEPNKGLTCENITIADSECSNNAGNGIHIYGGRGTVRNVRILNFKGANNKSNIYASQFNDISIDDKEWVLFVDWCYVETDKDDIYQHDDELYISQRLVRKIYAPETEGTYKVSASANEEQYVRISDVFKKQIIVNKEKGVIQAISY